MRDFQTKANKSGLADSITATRFGSGEFNALALENEYAVSSSDQSLYPADGTGETTDQLAKALAIYGAGGAAYHVDTGAVNAYVLNPVSPKESPDAYFDGFTVIFEPGTANTGASTVNIGSIGVKSITDQNGYALLGGEISETCQLKYNLTDDRFEIVTLNMLFGPRTYYVRTDGSDSNDGRSNTAGGAFLTLQKAADTVHALDLNGQSVTIFVNDGTYNAGVAIAGPFKGGGSVLWSANASTSSVIVVDTICFEARDGAVFSLENGYELRGSTSALYAINFGSIKFSDIAFGASGIHCYATRLGYIEATGTYDILGDADNHIQASHQGNFRASAGSATFQANVAFTTTVECLACSDVTYTGGSDYDLNTYTVTGTRWSVIENAIIQIAGGSYTSIPGDADGIENTGGLFYTTALEPRYYIGTVTRDISLASGTQVVSGVGFAGTTFDFIVVVNGTYASSVGFDGTNAYCKYNNSASTVGTDAVSTTYSIVLVPSTGNVYSGQITAIDIDGFTITWTKTGSPTGTATILFKVRK